jgi:hypothetical protein
VGHAAAEIRWSAGHERSKHVLTTLARLAEAGKPLPSAGQWSSGISAGAQPSEQKRQAHRLIEIKPEFGDRFRAAFRCTKSNNELGVRVPK